MVQKLAEGIGAPLILRLIKNFFPEQTFQKDFPQAVREWRDVAALMQLEENRPFLNMVVEELRRPPRWLPYILIRFFGITDEKWKEGVHESLNYCSQQKWINWFLGFGPDGDGYLKSKGKTYYAVIIYTDHARSYLNHQIPRILSVIRANIPN